MKKERKPPKRFWIVFDRTTGAQVGSNYSTKREASFVVKAFEGENAEVAGPYELKRGGPER